MEPVRSSNNHVGYFQCLQNALSAFLERIQKCVQPLFSTMCAMPLCLCISSFYQSFQHTPPKGMLEKKAEHDLVRDKGWGPLLNDAYFHYKEARLLQRLKTHDVNEKDVDGATPLHAACLSGNLRVVQILLDKGANIEATEMRGQTPMHWAAQRGHTQCINLLKMRGANVNARDEFQRTPLRQAAKNGHEEAISALISHGANIEAEDVKKQTPYFVASLHGQMYAAECLKNFGAKTQITNSDGKTVEDVVGRAGFCAYARQASYHFHKWNRTYETRWEAENYYPVYVYIPVRDN